MPIVPRVYTVAELTVVLQLSEDTVRKAIRLGQIRIIEAGDPDRPQVRIPRRAVREWLRNAKPRRHDGTRCYMGSD